MKTFIKFFAICGLMLSLSGCWLFVAGAGAEAGYVGAQDDRTTSETLTDQRISTTIKTQFLADSDISALKIDVDSFRANVTLKGAVSSVYEADKAVRVAQEVSGVKTVTSKLAVIK